MSIGDALLELQDNHVGMYVPHPYLAIATSDGKPVLLGVFSTTKASTRYYLPVSVIGK